MNVEWNKNYPPKGLLRKDVNALVDATLHTLFKYFNKKSIHGIYYKGSSSKPWDSIIDYVPGVSDVDIHIQFTNNAVFDKIINNPSDAMRFSEDNEKRFRIINKRFYHMPELQLNSLNSLHQGEEYRSSPYKAVKVLYGKPYPLTKISDKKIIKISRDQIIGLRAYVDKLPSRILDKDSLSMKKFLKDLGWRVNPQAANFLVANNISYDEAFSMNRTAIASTFRRLGFNNEANNFEGFYYHSWRYHLNKDHSNLKKAIIGAYTFLDKTISRFE